LTESAQIYAKYKMQACVIKSVSISMVSGHFVKIWDHFKH